MKRLNYSVNNIDGLIKCLEDYSKSIETKGELFVRRLAEIGLPVIDATVASTKGDADTGYNKSYIEVEGNTARLIFEGNDVLFIEFGAGVHYNGEAGKSPHPKGAEFGYTIGSYGEGHGKQDSWFYRDETGSLWRSFGTEASMPMYKASMEIVTNIRRIANEVFG